MSGAGAMASPTSGASPRHEPSEAVPALALTDICKSWRRRMVLDGAQLHLGPATVAWLGGGNGVGKTTLLRIAAGLIAPERGTVRLEGLDPFDDRTEYQRRLGFLSAGDHGLYARLSVARNLAFWAAIALVPPRKVAGVVEQALRDMGLGDLAQQRVDRLSMGQRQRVRIAMAFLHSPRVVLLDEPHTSLDDDAMALVRESLARHRSAGGSAVWCAPSREHVDLPADASFKVRDGRVEAV